MASDAEDIATPSGGEGSDAIVAVRSDDGSAPTRKRGVTKKRARRPATSKQIRNLERQLERFGEGMPPSVRRKKEAELEGLRALSVERSRRSAEARNVQKYRMVKFFDRRKVERRLNSTDAAVRAQAQRDMRYVREFPRDAKYVALYPKNGHTEQSRAQVERMRAIIEGRPPVGSDAPVPEPSEPEREEEQPDDFFLPA